MFCRKVTLKVTSTAGSTCTLTLQSTALRTLVLLMGWISISRVRHLDTTGGKKTSQKAEKCPKWREGERGRYLGWGAPLLWCFVSSWWLRKEEKMEYFIYFQQWWNIGRRCLKLTQQSLLIVEGAATDTHLLVKRVQELVETQHRTENTHQHTHSEGTETTDTRHTLFCLVLGSYLPILVVPAAPYQKRSR